MDKLIITSEEDFRKIIKSAFTECMETITPKERVVEKNTESFISRKEVAQFLGISLVTLTDWMKQGLPFHKINGRVFFQRSEVIEYVKSDHLPRTKSFSQLHNSGHGK